MVESGTIVLHIAAKSAALAPTDASGPVGVTSWAVAALNSVEPCVRNLIHLDVFHAGGTWTKERRPQAEAALDEGLAALSAWPDGKEYLEDRFTAGELMMTTALRALNDSGVLARFPVFDAYRRRCEARPAFGRAREAQPRPFRGNVPA